LFAAYDVFQYKVEEGHPWTPVVSPEQVDSSFELGMDYKE
jgi:hypothetical protein